MKKIFIISLIVFLIDFGVKVLITKFMEINDSIILIPNFLNFTLVNNYGAAWSLFKGQGWLLVIISLSIIIGVIYYIIKKKDLNTLEIIGYSFLIGGSLGNLFDRIIYGYVIDFLDFNILGYDYPIFNLADSFIVIGIAILVIYSFKKK